MDKLMTLGEFITLIETTAKTPNEAQIASHISMLYTTYTSLPIYEGKISSFKRWVFLYGIRFVTQVQLIAIKSFMADISEKAEERDSL